MELTYATAYELLKGFDPKIHQHFKRITEPKGGERYFIYDPDTTNKSNF